MKNKKRISKTYCISPGVHLLLYDYVDYDIYYEDELDSVEYNWTIRIDHCLNGRLEAEFTSNKYSYIESGQFAINTTNYSMISSSFPLGQYQGLSIIIHEEELEDTFKEMLKVMEIDLQKINEKVDHENAWFSFRSTGKLEHVFGEVYAQTEVESVSYLWLKVLEILYFIQQITIENRLEIEYFSGSAIDKIKEAVSGVISDLESSIDVNSLIEYCDMNTNYFYRLFKKVYGMPPAKYFREFKLNRAAGRLVNSSDSIQQIALEAGYNNPSKFASAFRRVYNMTPREFRQKNLSMEHFKKE